MSGNSSLPPSPDTSPTLLRTLPWWGTGSANESGNTDWNLTLDSASSSQNDVVPSSGNSSSASLVPDNYQYFIWSNATITLTTPPNEYLGKIASYTVVLTPAIEGSFRLPPPPADIQLHTRIIIGKQYAPTAEQLSTEYSTAMGVSFSVNAGFFDDAITGGASASLSITKTVSSSVPDVTGEPFIGRDQASFRMDLNNPTSFSAVDSFQFGVEALFTIQGFTPMWLAYVDFATYPARSSAPSYPPVNPPEDETGVDVPPITPAMYNTWNTGQPSDQYNLVFARATAIQAAFNFGCRVDFKLTTTSGVDLPVPSMHLPLPAPPLKVMGTSDDWNLFLSRPPSIPTSLPGPARVKTSTIIGGLIYGDVNYAHGADVPQGLAVTSRMFSYQTLRSWSATYGMTIDPTTGAMSVSVQSGINLGSVLWTGVGGKNPATDGSPLVLEITNTDITCLVATTRQVVYNINIATTSRVPDDGTITSSLATLKLDDQGKYTYWYNICFPTANNDPRSPFYRRLDIDDDGTVQYIDYNGTVLWSSKPAPYTAQQIASDARSAAQTAAEIAAAEAGAAKSPIAGVNNHPGGAGIGGRPKGLG